MPFPPTIVLVTVTGPLDGTSGTGGNGLIVFQLDDPLYTPDGVLIGQLEPLSAKVVDGQFSAQLPVLPPGSTYTVTVHTDAFAPKPYKVFVPSTPTSTTIGSLPPINGPTAPTPTTPLALLKLWQLAELYAGLVNPAALQPYPENDPNNGITLAPGIYENFLFDCSELILPISGIKLYNCRILCGNANFGVRLDANTGFETGRYLEHCEITALGTAMSGAGFTARLVKVTGNGDDSARLGRSYAEGSVFELCHFSDYRPAPGAHADGIQIVTPPAADVVVWGCSISMNTAAGYTLPSDAGYTGALFVDTSDVPIPVDDPQPSRLGGIWVDSCRLVSSNNYSVVVDGPNTDIRNSTLLPGTTAIESIQPGITVTGGNNVDATGVPITDTDIHGDPRSRYLTVGDPRVTDGFPPATTGQVPTYNGTTWVAQTPTGGGGGTRMDIQSGFITSGNVAVGGTGAEWTIVAGTERSIAAVAGEQLNASFGFAGLDTSALYFDFGVVVGGEIVRQLYSPVFPPGPDYEGAPGSIHDPNISGVLNNPPFFDAEDGDLSGGTCTFCVLCRGNTTGTLLMSTDVPVTYTLYNNHQ